IENQIPFDRSGINSQTSGRVSIHASPGQDPGRESLSSMGIGDGEKDLIAASEFSEINSFGGRGDEVSYNNFSIRRISSSGSQLASSIPDEIDLRRMSSPANSSRRESIF
nr:hypothetical protein [Tanacetum cinerariifolium]